MQPRIICRFLSLGALLCAVTLGGCATPRPDPYQTAKRLAQDGGMAFQTLDAGPFQLTTFVRTADHTARPLTVYIEGDGRAWRGYTVPPADPTPLHPTGLTLAALDPSPHVIYLARPCQYSGLRAPGARSPCPQRYWTTHRFSPAVIAAYHEALNTLKTRHQTPGFHLVGFSGGGAVAVLLASERTDILSLRTVAGNLDTEAVNRHHKVAPLPASLNPVDHAAATAPIPQLHVTGTRDNVVPPVIYENHARAVGAPNCLLHIAVDATHTKGWEAFWPRLSQQPPPDCTDKKAQ